ncbi:MAG: MutS-related protein [Candidatus Acidiferrales bacterium]
MSDPRAEYGNRLEANLRRVANSERVHIQIGNFKLAAICGALVIAFLSLAKHRMPLYWLAVPVAIYVGLAVWHEFVIRARTAAERAAEFYRKGIARIEDGWAGTGETGERFRSLNSVYADDLDLFARGGLFELLSRARLPMGENRLARWLCAPSAIGEIRERHESLAVLREKIDLRERVAVTGEGLRTRLAPESLTAWCNGERMVPASGWRAVAASLAICATATFIYFLWSANFVPLLAVLFVEFLVYLWLHKRAESVVNGILCNAEGLALFSKIVNQLEDEEFGSTELQGLVDELKQDGARASGSIRKLSSIVYWIDAREGLVGRILELPMLYTVQSAFAAESWRERYGRRMSRWSEIVAEMEALLSLAAYSFEHPDDPFPEFVDDANSTAIFDGEALGHPLIAASRCVRNSVRLDEAARVLLVSGSNMAGKSTFLRTVGINAVMAMAGAPVRAKSLRLTPLSIGTRIRSADSLQEGRSSFYTEILQIRQVFELLGAATPLLFLFDELLEGTNSNDRKIGAECLIRSLLNRGAIGIVTTHDLALTEIAEASGGLVRNMHFQDYVEDGKMRFDYRLREGVVAKSNALELMRLVGLKL